MLWFDDSKCRFFRICTWNDRPTVDRGDESAEQLDDSNGLGASAECVVNRPPPSAVTSHGSRPLQIVRPG